MSTDKDISWTPDAELEGFEVQPVEVQSHGRQYRATLVRACNNPRVAHTAILYLHGFTDYFFQTHLARACVDEGCAFYALDLHGYGRSMRTGERANYCHSIEEYFAELDEAVRRIKATGAERLVINAHSTGGLVSSLYADRGSERAQLDGLILNSPFFDFALSGVQRVLLNGLVWLGRFFPTWSYHHGMPSLYGQSIYCGYRGEWDYNLTLKPVVGFPIFLGWIRAVVLAQRQLQAGLHIECPVLVLHSARSLKLPSAWTDELMGTDVVLDVDHMRRYGPGLGQNVSLVEIEGGMHDLILSPQPAREQVIHAMFRWLGQVSRPEKLMP
ncbi:alpha/beta hydrolase [Gilvimarinus sp. DA14]|uniref:alpha/beta hydrolase n=1 Tax=Gilvimarinus sp. DA14 TaxID=2956798 RepID=UPI0020B679FE|nr:alpha/beta hydrolase [Gilvimarinus sp. DA14]UTF58846.1 alpha/beta hydrolase [Gilvimarinus sp. DA14]